MKVFLGLEIGTQYLKIAIATCKRRQSKIIDCEAVPVMTLKDDQITEAIVQILKKNSYKPEFIGLSLPRNFVTVRNLHLPTTDKNEMAKMLELHIGRIIPYKKEEVVFAHNFSGVDTMGYSRVILAIAHNDIIRRPLSIIEKAGFSVDEVTISSSGVLQWVMKNFTATINKTGLYLILDIDSVFTDLIFFDHDNILFTRSISITAQEIQTDLGQKKLLGEVRQSLLIFSNEEMSKKPEMIFLGGAAEERLAKTIETELSVKVVNIPPPVTEGVLKAKKRSMPEDVSIAGVTNLVVGEKKGGVSFVLPEIEIRKSLREKTRELVFVGVLVVYFLSIVCFLFLVRIHHQQGYLRKLTEHSKKIEEDFGEVRFQMGNISAVGKFVEKRKIPLLILSQLQQAITENVHIDLLSLSSDNRVVLRGEATQMADVFSLLTRLDKTKYFKDVKTSYQRRRMLKDKEVTEFELNFFLEY